MSSSRAFDYGRMRLEWRQLARSGSPDERIDLLAQILAVAPPETRGEWQTNLINAETAWFAELRHKLDEFSEPELTARYNRLISGHWLSAPPEKLTAKAAARLAELKRDAANLRLDPFVDETAAAFAAQDFDRLAKLSAEWQGSLADNLPEMRRQEAEIMLKAPFEWFASEQKLRAENLEFDRRLAELHRLIDDRADFPAIDQAFRSVMLFDRPLDNSGATVAAVERLQNEYQIGQHRQSARRRMLIITGFVVVLTAFTVGFYVIKNRKTATEAEVALTAAIQAGETVAAEQIYRALPSSIAARPAIRRLGEKAIALNAKAADTFAVLAKQMENPSNKIDQYLAEAEKLSPLLSRQDAAHLAALKLRRREQLAELSRQTTRKLAAGIVILSDRLDGLGNRLEQIPAEKAAMEFADLEKQSSALLSAPDLSPEAVADARKAWLNRRQAFLARRAEVEHERRFFKSLQAPDSFGDYMEALARLPLEHPELKPQYAAALQMRPCFEAFMLGKVNAGELDDPAARAAAIERNLKLRTGIRQSALYALTGETPAERKRGREFAEKLIRFIENTPLAADLYELRLTGKDNAKYWFYASKPPKVTDGEVTFEMAESGGHSAGMRFSRHGNQLNLADEDNGSSRELPGRYRTADTLQPTPSPHGFLLRTLAERIAGTDQPPRLEAELINTLCAAAATSTMNPLAKAELLDSLLVFIAELDPEIGSKMRTDFEAVWRPAAAGRKIDWLRPDEAARCRDLAAISDEAAAAVIAANPAKAFQTRRATLARLLAADFRPAALLTQNANGEWLRHLIANAKFTNFYVLGFTPDGRNQLEEVTGLDLKQWPTGLKFTGQVIFGAYRVTASALPAPR